MAQVQVTLYFFHKSFTCFLKYVTNYKYPTWLCLAIKNCLVQVRYEKLLKRFRKVLCLGLCFFFIISVRATFVMVRSNSWSVDSLGCVVILYHLQFEPVSKMLYDVQQLSLVSGPHFRIRLFL